MVEHRQDVRILCRLSLGEVQIQKRGKVLQRLGQAAVRGVEAPRRLQIAQAEERRVGQLSREPVGVRGGWEVARTAEGGEGAMVEKRQFADDQRLQARQALEDIAKPVRVRAVVDLGMGGREVQRVGEASRAQPGPGEGALEAREGD